jgi:hypothetical protein
LIQLDFSGLAAAGVEGSEKRVGAAGRRVIGRVYGRVNGRRINRKVVGKG